jgi:hypothetical protein
MISSTSRRLPRKTCGLFDTGFAGGALDVASLDLSVPADIDQSLFNLGGDSSSENPFSEGKPGSSTAIDHNVVFKVDAPPAPGLMDEWNYDLLDPLGGLDNPLADDSLDAFVNLDQFFMGDSFFDNESLIAPSEPLSDLAEVKPVIDIPTQGGTVFIEPVLPAQSPLTAEVKAPQTARKPATNKTSRKRKAQTTGAPVETSLFKVPEVKSIAMVVDHDYTARDQGGSSSCETKEKSYSNKGKKSTPKRQRFSSTASDDSVVSSTSMIDIEVFEDETSTPLDKQTVRRIKNNVASKRSREQRKQKFADMDVEAEKLIVENERLRNKIVELEKLAKEMKETLVAKMAGKS